MAQSLSKIYVHIIFRIVNNGTPIRPEDATELYTYMGGVINHINCIPIQINGMPDHIHILCLLSKNIALIKLVEEIKRNSSRWIKSKGVYYRNFAWQGGYGAFSVSADLCDNVKNYIISQPEHHRKESYQEEYLKLLDEYEVNYNEEYLWRD